MTLRRVPDDFRVDEQLRDDVARGLQQPRGGKSGRAFAVFQLTKTSLTTEGAAARLGRALGVSRAQISYAGLKDKHAHTTQHMTVGPLELTTRVPEQLSGDGWAAQLIGWSKEPAAAAWIRRNRFTITVRSMSHHRAQAIDAAAGFLALSAGRPAAARKLLFVNYFGDQRFGSARHGEGFVARHLIRAEFEQALRLAIGAPARKDSGKRRTLTRRLYLSWGDWKKALAGIPACPERKAVEILAAGGTFRDAFETLPYFFQQMCVEAYQSHLWNNIARAIAIGVGGRNITNEHGMHALVFPEPSRVSVPLRSLEIPMLAPSTRLVEPWGDVAKSVLSSEGVELANLAIPGMRRPAFGEAWRPLFVIAEQFVISAAEPDELSERDDRLKRVVSFDLPRGAYATILLRALGC